MAINRANIVLSDSVAGGRVDGNQFRGKGRVMLEGIGG